MLGWFTSRRIDLADEPRARGRVVEALPARELVEHIETQLVRGFEERRIRRIVRHAHRVHVGALDEARVGVVLRARERAAGVGREAVPVDALEHDLAAVEIDAIARPHFERAKTEALLELMQRVLPRDAARTSRE